MQQKPLVPISHKIGAMFLVAGACVGGGMLALPVETGVSGLLPSLLAMLVSWAFMTATGLLYVEASLWMEEGAHVMTMASKLLGFPGKVLAMVLYLFIGYASLVAYNAAGGNLVEIASADLIGLKLSFFESCALFALVFGLMFYLGTRVLGRVNTILVIGMIATYVLMISSGLPEVQSALLTYRNWARGFFALPLVIATFSFQMIVPSLTPYLKRDAEALRSSVFWGATIPFIVYGVWQVVVLGIVPLEGEYGLIRAWELGMPATWSLRGFVDSRLPSISADFFAFFALVTSYLAIGLGTYDFVADAFKIPKRGLGKLFLGLVVVLPSLYFAVTYARVFIVALSLTGGFGDTILNGLMPITMVWIGRYRRKIEGPYTLTGGKPMLFALTAFALLVIYVQIRELAG